MNELAAAGCNRLKYCDPKHPDLEGWIISQEVLDNLTELIIRECAAWLETTAVECELAGELLNHFGVSE